MKYPLIAVALAASAFSHSASAQWGGIGDSGWGWKRPECHLCLSAVEVTVSGGKGSTDDIAYRSDLAAGESGDRVEVSQEAKHAGAAVRIGLGKRIFLDGGYKQITTEGSDSAVETERKFTQIRYGAGVFLLSEPKIGAIYLRAGALSLDEDVDLSLKPAGAGRDGYSFSYTPEELNEFGGALGGFWNRGNVRLEASYGIYGDVKEGILELSYGFNERLYFVLGATMLDIEGRDTTPFTSLAPPADPREYTYEPADSETLTTYGLGLRLRF